MNTIIKYALNILLVTNILFAGVIIFYERRKPISTWAWFMVIILIPYFGFFLYLMFGLDSRKHKVFAYKAKVDNEIYKNFIDLSINRSDLLNEQLQIMTKDNILAEKNTAHFNDLIYLNFISADSLYTNNNKIDIYHNGVEMFDDLIKNIKLAKKFIHLEYYIFKNDELGRRIISILTEKAREGVEVCLCIDGVGNYTNPKKMFSDLIKSGGKVAYFLPPYFVRMNFRNHRKICIIDGEMGYVGGLNVGDEYLGKSKRFGQWRDCHIKILGDSVNQLEVRFIMDWNFCIGRNNTTDIINVSEKYFSTNNLKTGNTAIQIVSSGPDTKWESIKYGYSKMITEADKRIYIETPYFIPDDCIFESLKIAALSGNDVRIIIPANPDHAFVFGAAISYLAELVEAGVRCYKYEKGFVHSKLIMVDGLITSVGTANMDIRSFALNFEINAFIYDRETTKKFEKQFLLDLEDCTEINAQWLSERSLVDRIKGPISRLLSPLL